MNSIYQEMSLSGIQTQRIQWIAVAGSLILLGVIFQLVRRHRLSVEYSLLWFGCGLLFLGISVIRSSLETLAKLVGIAYPPAALLLLLLMGLYALALHYSLVISRLSKTCDVLAQELALLSAEHKELARKTERILDREMEAGKG